MPLLPIVGAWPPGYGWRHGLAIADEVRRWKKKAALESAERERRKGCDSTNVTVIPSWPSSLIDLLAGKSFCLPFFAVNFLGAFLPRLGRVCACAWVSVAKPTSTKKRKIIIVLFSLHF